jgi:hypothetical protein
MNSSESSRQAWDDEGDSEFMRITASLFSLSFRYGASGLVTSYDLDDALTATASSPVQTAPAARGGADRKTRRSWIHATPADRTDRHSPITTRSSR